VEERLGAGGMGVVYRARSDAGRVVALKVIRGEWADSPDFRARFELEVAAARMVHSRHTVPVVDSDPYAATPWMATEYVDGLSLARHVREHGPLDVGELRALGAGLAEALRDIHRTGVVHRDLKPGNVLLDRGRARVIDFGVSRAMDGIPLTRSGHPVGTPAYTAPEQVRTPQQAGPAADVFALGCVLVFAATGRSPFDSDSPWAAAYRAAHEEPDLDGVPELLVPLVLRLLSKDPILRPVPGEVLSLLARPGPPRPGHGRSRR
jgi:serine/threonine protein kinase